MQCVLVIELVYFHHGQTVRMLSEMQNILYTSHFQHLMMHGLGLIVMIQNLMLQTVIDH